MNEFDLIGWNGTVVTELREVHPGHFWQYVEIEGAELIFTGAFQVLPIDERTHILNLLNVFVNRAGSPRDYRMGRRIENGTEGKVSTFGDDHVIKILNYVTNDYDGIEYPTRMLNMSLLSEYVRSNLPGWVDVVEDYLYFNNGKINFTVMPRVGNGVSIYDLGKYHCGFSMKDTYIEEYIRRDFPGFDVYHMGEILDQFDSIKGMLSELLDPSYDELPTMQDYKKSNVLVTPLVDPIDGHNFKLWIIDQ